MKRFFKKIFKYFLVTCIVLFVCMVVLRVYQIRTMKPYISDQHTQMNGRHFAAGLILGAGVREDGRMSGILYERAAAGLELYQQGVYNKIIVSGDALEPETYNEVKPVREFLIASGVPASDILVDPNGYDTYASIYNAQHTFGINDIVLLTQGFHLPRSVYIARGIGMNAHGFVAFKIPYSSTFNKYKDLMRELPGALDAFLEVNLGKTP